MTTTLKKLTAMLDDQSPIDQDLKYAMLTFDAMNEDQHQKLGTSALAKVQK